MARIGGAGRVAGRAPSKMIEVQQPAVRALGRRAVLVGRHAVQLDVRAGRSGRLEVRIAGADQQDQPQPVGRHDRPGLVVDGELVGRAVDARSGPTSRTSTVADVSAARRR